MHLVDALPLQPKCEILLLSWFHIECARYVFYKRDYMPE